MKDFKETIQVGMPNTDTGAAVSADSTIRSGTITQAVPHTVKRARVLGYCMGVRRAVDAVLNALADYPDKTVYTYGPLIHNPVTMQLLEQKGVRVVDPEQEIQNQIEPESPIIIRAHGISPQKRQELADCKAIIIDATCPRVIASQKRAARYAEKGYTVILAGDKNHGELIGIMGHALAIPHAQCLTVQNAEEARTLDVEYDDAPAVLLAQTTIKRNEYRAIADILYKKIPQLVVLETICPATDERQDALLELLHDVDAVVVIGGKTSANTRRLLQTALDSGKPAWLAESLADIPEDIHHYHRIGLAAGASTPDSSIDALAAALDAI